MLLFFRGLTGKTFTLIAEPYNSVGDLKQKIEDKIGQPFDTIRLICAGKGLEDQRTLTDYQIQEYATVFMVLRLRGA